MIPFHPLANIFPLIEGTDFSDLVCDVREHGIREPIILFERQILDGRNRYRAAVAAKLLPESLDQLTVKQIGLFKHFVPMGAPAPTQNVLLAFVISKNLRRRHLDDSQRGIIGARLANLGHGGNRKTDQAAKLPLEKELAPVSQAKAAEMVNVSERTIRESKVVLDRAVAEIIETVDRGHLSVFAAADIAELPPERQAEIVKALPRNADGKLTPEARKALAPIIKEVRAENQIEKKQKRDAKEATLGAKIAAKPEGKFGVVLEDFEWDHKPYSRATGMDRHPSNHYPTSDAHTPEEILERTKERFGCADETCVLYMWTTIPHAAIAMDVMRLRGFAYKSQRIWDKVRPGAGRGPGYWVTGEHEILLIGTRGAVVAPVTAHYPSRFEAVVGEHSEKPDQQYEHAEFHFPNLPKVELNARRRRAGWTSWGFEAPTGDIETQTPDRAASKELPEGSAPDVAIWLPDFLNRDRDNLLPLVKRQTVRQL